MNTIQNKANTFILGSRKFSRDIPFRSCIGNTISRFVYLLALGKYFQDTQTGLRGLSKPIMEKSLIIKSNRFEFETNQLALVTQPNSKIKIIEIPIETKYFSSNKASSFRPLIDSFQIYFVLARYLGTSIVIFFIDILIFTGLLEVGSTILISNLLARAVTIVVQFFITKNFVFKSTSGIRSFLFFVFYVLLMGLVSVNIQLRLSEFMDIKPIVSKMLTEGVLFFVNFAFLRTYIFMDNEFKNKKTNRDSYHLKP